MEDYIHQHERQWVEEGCPECGSTWCRGCLGNTHEEEPEKVMLTFRDHPALETGKCEVYKHAECVYLIAQFINGVQHEDSACFSTRELAQQRADFLNNIDAIPSGKFLGPFCPFDALERKYSREVMGHEEDYSYKGNAGDYHKEWLQDANAFESSREHRHSRRKQEKQTQQAAREYGKRYGKKAAKEQLKLRNPDWSTPYWYWEKVGARLAAKC